jgi:hypothetical protein
MNRLTTFLLTGIMLLGLAFTVPPQTISFAQSDPFVGTWQLNLAKSEYKTVRPPKAQTLIVQGEGQNRTATVTRVDEAGNSLTRVFKFIHDSQPHPVIGDSGSDAITYTRFDDNTVIWIGTKGGQAVAMGTDTLSRDGKMFTITVIRFDVNGRPINNISVFDKQ